MRPPRTSSASRAASARRSSCRRSCITEPPGADATTFLPPASDLTYPRSARSLPQDRPIRAISAQRTGTGPISFPAACGFEKSSLRAKGATPCQANAMTSNRASWPRSKDAPRPVRSIDGDSSGWQRQSASNPHSRWPWQIRRRLPPSFKVTAGAALRRPMTILSSALGPRAAPLRRGRTSFHVTVRLAPLDVEVHEAVLGAQRPVLARTRPPPTSSASRAASARRSFYRRSCSIDDRRPRGG
jgi:hypothetical protein